ncbi:hypothetical protein GALL_535500 [mine drainage metagenome]|uniref:Uncharacterized protein n=1 Tax=mine drainage metagenome TaxID=410659 RepID=A0A1J5P2K7_9ZZZZ
MALPTSWGPFTSTTSTRMPPAAAVSSFRAPRLAAASQTTAMLVRLGQTFFMALMTAS